MNKSKFLDTKNENHTIDQFSELIKKVVQFKNRKNVTNFKTDEYLKQKYSGSIPNSGLCTRDLQLVIDDIMNYSTNFSSPNFMGFPDAGNSIAGLMGGIIEATLQQNLLNSSFCAKAATFIEISTVRWIRELIGYENKELKCIKDLGGVATVGGTSSNMYGILMARNAAFPESSSTGLPECNNAKILCAKNVTHYSIRGALNLVGLGTNNLIEVPTKNFRLDLLALRTKLEQCKFLGYQVICFILNAGDSRTLTIDPLSESINLIKFFYPDCWIHIDGCHGTQLLFSKKYKSRILGLKQADSISLDPHKTMNIPYTLSYFIFKDLKNVDNFWTSSQLITGDKWSLGQLTPSIGSKSWASLKLYLFILHMGKEAIGEMIDKRIDLASYFRLCLDKKTNFKTVTLSSDINSVPFIFLTKRMLNYSTELIYNINERIYKKLLEEGEFYFHGFPLMDDCNILNRGSDQKLFVLRYMSGNPHISKALILKAIERIEAIGKSIECGDI
jgi:L-2,4-diaminobutyrate decarboxylase